MYKLNLFRTREVSTVEETIDLLENQYIQVTRPDNTFGFYSVYDHGVFVAMAETLEEIVDIANTILDGRE